ncbi:unnamed protein product [Anisakis simplex]|uniref:Uncharacterized protein n=1 Tax=Anisakis simplex TaxID=6269 RepID=A0A0M3KAM5_ANISI|nr:unnamed protein product [Anisakis simplex]
MPRRKGEYTLNKSTSYAILPGLVANDIYAGVGVSSAGSCRTTFRLNMTANDADLLDFANEENNNKNDDSLYFDTSTKNLNKSFMTQAPSKERNVSRHHRGALLRELFYRKSREKENTGGYRGSPAKVRPQDRLTANGYYRAPSCDSPCRLPYRCPLDKMRIKTPLSSRKHSKQPPVRVLSFVSLLPEAQTVQYVTTAKNGTHVLRNGYVKGSFLLLNWINVTTIVHECCLINRICA